MKTQGSQEKLGEDDQLSFVTRESQEKSDKNDILDSTEFKLAMQEALNPPIDHLLGVRYCYNDYTTIVQLAERAVWLMGQKYYNAQEND